MTRLIGAVTIALVYLMNAIPTANAKVHEIAATQFCGDRYGACQDAGNATRQHQASTKHVRRVRVASRGRAPRQVRKLYSDPMGFAPYALATAGADQDSRYSGAQAVPSYPAAGKARDANSNSASLSGSSLVNRARSYLGTNPTGWGHLWCGRFMAMIAPDAAARVKNPNWARDYARLPHVTPQVGAIAVISRGRGGHVGVVTGFDNNGNPIIVSGNHNGVVGEGAYPRGRVIAYVDPSG